MKKIILLICIVATLFTSCELFTHGSGKRVRLVSVALDYANTDVSVLNGTINDQSALLNQLIFLSECEGTPFSATCFTEEGDECSVTMYDEDLEGQMHIFYDSYSRSTLKNLVVTKLEEMAKDSRDGDLTIFYYAGHGVSVKEREANIRYLKGAMVLGEINFTSVGDWRTASENLAIMLSLSELRRLISNFKGESVIILDSCYSGYIVEDDKGITNEKEYKEAFDSLFSISSVKERKMWQLTAAREDELSYEEGGIEELAHGRFTKAILKSMGYRFGIDYETPGVPESRTVSLSGLWDYASKELKYRNQTPQASQSALDLILFNL